MKLPIISFFDAMNSLYVTGVDVKNVKTQKL